MKQILALIIAVGLCGTLSAQEFKDPRVVKIPGCTGFFVDDHYMFTAKHCAVHIGSTLKVGDQDLKLVYITPANDGPAVYYSAKVKESFKLAGKPQAVGDSVYTVGFPGGNYATIYGRMESGDGTTFNRAAMRIQPGHSGGPLINKKSEIIGLALGVDVAINSNHSYFAGWGLINTALAKSKDRIAGKKEKGEIVIFTQSDKDCPPCALFHKEMEEELIKLDREGIKITEVGFIDGEWTNKELIREYSQTTGKSGVGTPTVWLRGTKETKIGFRRGDRLSVIGWLFRGLKNLGVSILGNSKDGVIDDSKIEALPLLPLVPGVEEDGEVGLVQPELKPVEEMTWEDLTIVIVLSKRELGFVKGRAAVVALNAIRGPLARANEEHLQGKAEIVLIPERTEPQRYSAFTSAAGIDPPLFYVVVLVKKRDLGLKGLIASRVERAFSEKLPEGTPVELVFERVHSNSYLNIKNALRVVEQGQGSPSDSLKDSIVAAVKDQVLGVVDGKLEGIKDSLPNEDSIAGKVITNLGPAIKENGDIQKANGEDASLWQKILAGLIATVLGGQATGGVRGYLKEKAMEKLGLEIDSKDKKDGPTS
jgi:hypothetical protein